MEKIPLIDHQNPLHHVGMEEGGTGIISWVRGGFVEPGTMCQPQCPWPRCWHEDRPQSSIRGLVRICPGSASIRLTPCGRVQAAWKGWQTLLEHVNQGKGSKANVPTGRGGHCWAFLPRKAYFSHTCKEGGSRQEGELAPESRHRTPGL